MSLQKSKHYLKNTNNTKNLKKLFSLMLLILCVSFLISTPQALAATSYTLKGYGFGHGIGLCQWGARGRAESGQDYKQILTHYYQGTQVTTVNNIPSTVRVRLFGKSNVSKAIVEAENSSTLSFIKTDSTYVSNIDNTIVYKGVSGKWSILPSPGGFLKLVQPDGIVAVDRIPAPIIVLADTTDPASGLVVYKDTGARYRAYKGSIYVYPTGTSSLYLVNYVDFEPHYLNGLGEVPSSWPYDALYAQAVAARSYAVANMKPQATFDLYDDTSSQVYRGLDKIRETSSSGYNWGARWAKAVQDTNGQVVTYNGAAIPAFYFSSCGGHTESIELSWVKASSQPYLTGVSDLDPQGNPYCGHEKNTSFTWSKTISKADFAKALGVQEIANVKITERGLSPRLVELKVTGRDGTDLTVRAGDGFRSKFGIKSSWVQQMLGSFQDVPMDYWAFMQIDELTDKGINKGYEDGTFRPANPVTRAEFSKMLCAAYNFPADSAKSFSDAENHWAESYIATLASRGVINGYSDGTFKPDMLITRAEICTIITRATNMAQGSAPAPFSDIENHWAKSSIELVASNSIVNGYMGGSFRPNSNATRAEVSAIIYRLLGRE